MTTSFTWTVRYRRRGWTHEQQRTYLSRFAARRLVSRLLAGDPDLGDLVELKVTRRALGPEESVPVKGWDQ